MNGCHIKPEQFFNLIFGYYDRYFEYSVDLNASAGAKAKDLSDVPAGEIWVIQTIGGSNASRAARIELAVYNGTESITLKDATSTTANPWVTWTGEIVLKAGDNVRVIFYGSTLGDDLYWRAWGYKMKIA